jgi:hypothetical protein
MSKIKGSNLTKLGFKKAKERTSHELGEMNYHYYTFEINNDCLLISSTNDEKNLNGGGYYVEFYEMPEIRFTELEDLKALLKLLRKAKI